MSGPATTGATILLVDDRRNIAQALDALLTRAGYHVKHASTPQIALSLTHTRNHKVVCLRMEMTPVTGLDLLREIKRLSPPARVIMTADDVGLVAAIACMNEGAETVVMRPLDHPDELLSAVERAFAQIEHWRSLFARLQAAPLGGSGSGA